MFPPSTRPHAPGFLVPLLYGEVYGGVALRALLEDQLRRIDWRGVVEVAAGIAAASWSDGLESPRHQTALIRNFATKPLVDVALGRRLATEPHRPIFMREALLAVLRVAVSIRNEVVASQLDFNDAFLRAALIANELLANETLPPTPMGTARDLLASELRSQVLNIDNLHDLIARTEAFFDWAGTAEAADSENFLPVAVDFEQFTGLAWRAYAAAAYACLSRGIVPPGSPTNRSVLFSLDEWLAQVADAATIRHWFNISAIGVDEAQVKWGTSESLSLAASGILWRRPVLRAQNGMYFVPYPMLVQNAMGDGVYFALLDGYTADDPSGATRKRFTRFFGTFFESYLAERLEIGYAGRVDAEVRRQTLYRRGKSGILSTDAVVAENGDIFFFEVMAKRPNLLESVVALDAVAIEADAGTFVKKARELDKRIRDYRDGHYFTDLPHPAGQRIYPIIVTPTSWPRVHLLNTILPKAIADEGLLVGCEPIELMDAGDIELLEGGLQSGVRLGGLLDRKNANGQPTNARFKSINDYVVLYEPHLFTDKRRPSRERGSAAAREIIRLALTWFTPPN